MIEDLIVALVSIVAAYSLGRVQGYRLGVEDEQIRDLERRSLRLVQKENQL